MPSSQRTTFTPGAVRSPLLWMMILLSAWLAGSSGNIAKAAPSVAVTAPSATAATIDREEVLPKQVSRSEWQSIRTAYEANRHALQPSVQRTGSYEARNPGQQWSSTFNEEGVAISPDHGGWQFGLRLAHWGHAAQDQHPASLIGIDTHGQRTVYRYDDGLEEWFVNDERGLEHGFTMHQPPAGKGNSLLLALDIAGELTPRVAANGRDVALLDAHGNAALDYNHLQVWDADGRSLPARFASHGKQLALSVDARAAHYPITIDPIFQQQAYLKASNTDGSDLFGNSVAIAGDTVVVGAPREDSNAIGVNGNQGNNSAIDSGAAYVFVRDGAGNWSQQAYLKASNAGSGDLFGKSVAISGDTIVIGASLEASNANGVNGDPSDNSASQAGAVYVFVRDGTGNWAQQAYLKSSNSDSGDFFGTSVAIAGNIAVVGAVGEASNATGVDGNQGDNSATFAGAAYVFVRTGASTWTQRAYLKASNTASFDAFGVSVAIAGDTVVVGAEREDSNAIGVNGNQNDNSATDAGAAYVFVRDGAGDWSQQAYLKSSNTGSGDLFGKSVAISVDTVVVGASLEASNATGVNGDQSDNSASQAGAAYVFLRDAAGNWGQQAYLKASNTEAGDLFGESVTIDGDIVVIGARAEDSNATGVNGDQASNASGSAGAAYVFARGSGAWTQQAYLKASNTDVGDEFGTAVAIAGSMVLVGARFEDSSSTGINGNQGNNSAGAAGAMYAFDVSFTLGGTVTGLIGTGLVLQNSGGDDLAIAANGAFTFATRLADHSAYVVTVLTQPGGPRQTCTVANASGTLMGANVSNVAISCTTNQYTLGGTISGMIGNHLLLQNNFGGSLVSTGNGPFTFPAALVDGSAYTVTASLIPQAGAPSQTCTVSNGSGTLAGAPVTNVAVTCVTNQFTVGGTVTGLVGSGLVLRNNGGGDLAIAANGTFTFAAPLPDRSTYAVTVLTQPSGPRQTCTVANASGTLMGANVTNVAISCTTNRYTIGGTISGLNGNHLLLQNNAGGSLVATGNGPFTFPVGLLDGSFYSVTATVVVQPGSPSQTCTVSNGSGTLAGQPVTNIAVTCVTNRFTVGGTVTGLVGSAFVLRNNGGDDLAIAANGAFTFATPLDDLSTYIVTVATQPTGTSRFCSVINGSGMLAGANVTNVIIDCQPIGIDISPRRLEFAIIPVGQSSPAQMVVIENTGEVAFGVQTITVTGGASTDFALTTDTCSGAVLGPGEFCGFEVVFTPTSEGLRTADIMIVTDGFAQPFTISLMGGDTLFSDGFEIVQPN